MNLAVIRGRTTTISGIINFNTVFSGLVQQDKLKTNLEDKSFVEINKIFNGDSFEIMNGKEAQIMGKASVWKTFLEREDSTKIRNEIKEPDVSTLDILQKSQYCTPTNIPNLLCGMESNLFDYIYNKMQIDHLDYDFDFVSYQVDPTSETYFEICFVKINSKLPGPVFNAVLIWLGFRSIFYKCSFKIVTCTGPSQQTSSQTRSENVSSGSAFPSGANASTSLSYAGSAGGSSSGEGGGDDNPNRRSLNNLPADAPDLTPEELQRLEEEARSRQNGSGDKQGTSGILLTQATGLFHGPTGIDEAFDNSASVDEAVNSSSALVLRNHPLLHLSSQDQSPVARNVETNRQVTSMPVQQVQVLRRERHGDIFGEIRSAGRYVPRQLAAQMARTRFFCLGLPRAFSNHIGVRALRSCCGETFLGPPLQICQRCHRPFCSECEQRHREGGCP